MVALLLYKRLMHGMVSRMFFFSFFSSLPTSQNMNIFILMKKEVQKLKKYTHYFFNYLEKPFLGQIYRFHMPNLFLKFFIFALIEYETILDLRPQ